MRFRTRTIIIIILVLALLGAAIYFLILGLGGRQVSPSDSGGRPLFPFRDRGDQVDDDQIIDEDRQETPDEQITDERHPTRDRVFLVTNRPVIAFDTYLAEKEVTLTRQNEEGEPFEETVTAIETLVRFIDTRDGTLIEKNLDIIDDDELILTKPTVARAREGFVAGENGEIIVLRFFNDTLETLESFLGKRSFEEIPESICTTGIFDELSRGDSGPDVEQLQRILSWNLSLDIIVDGSFGSGTEAALKTFQINNGLEETGSTDVATRLFLDDVCVGIENDLAERHNQPAEVDGVFLRTDIHSMSISPDRNTLFYLITTDVGVTGYTLELDTRIEREIFTSPFSEWMSTWGSNNTVLLHSAPTGYLDGVAYEVDTDTEEFRRIFGDRTGLTSLQSPDGEKVLIGTGTESGLGLELHNSATNSTLELDLSTLPEKCTWSSDSTRAYCATPGFVPDGVYPDNWYKGLVEFRDNIWEIDAETGTMQQIAVTAEFFGGIDGVDLHLSENETYLLLRDRDSYALWGVDLTVEE